MTYYAYLMNDQNRPTAQLFEGDYSYVKGQVERYQAAHLRRHQEHVPVFITREIFAIH